MSQLIWHGKPLTLHRPKSVTWWNQDLLEVLKNCVSQVRFTGVDPDATPDGLSSSPGSEQVFYPSEGVLTFSGSCLDQNQGQYWAKRQSSLSTCQPLFLPSPVAMNACLKWHDREYNKLNEFLRKKGGRVKNTAPFLMKESVDAARESGEEEGRGADRGHWPGNVWIPQSELELLPQRPDNLWMMDGWIEHRFAAFWICVKPV